MFYERLKLVLFDTGERAVRRKFPSFLKRGTPNLILASKGETRLAMSFAYNLSQVIQWLLCDITYPQNYGKCRANIISTRCNEKQGRSNICDRKVCIDMLQNVTLSWTFLQNIFLQLYLVFTWTRKLRVC